MSLPISVDGSPQALPEVVPKELPHNVDIADLRRQLKFCWGRDVPLNPQTGRPLSDSVVWNGCNGHAQAAESKGEGGWVVVPNPEQNVPAGQLPPSFWANKEGAMKLLAMRAEAARLQRLVQDPLWEERELLREEYAPSAADAEEGR